MAQTSGKKDIKGKPISFRFRQETLDQLKAVATFHKRSSSNMIEVLIDTAFSNLEGAENAERTPVPTRRKK